MRDYREESFWFDTLSAKLTPRARLDADERCDVAIVGAGFTGLWIAYALSQIDPSIDVALCESDIAGAGASGRNGGWCMGEVSGLHGLLADRANGGAAARLQRLAFKAVDRIGRIAKEEGIDCRFAKGGQLRLASLAAHRPRLEEQVSGLRAAGFGEDDYRLLEPDECRERIRGRDFHGALYSPHVAALDPARLVRGLAEAVERRGVRIFEASPVSRVAPGSVETAHGRLRADRVVVATEAYTGTLAGRRRQLVPIHSMMIATEPLSPALWESIGLAKRETFADFRRITNYGQRTHDGRIAFGSRGLYRYGSGVCNRFAPDEPAFRTVAEVLYSLLPQVAGAQITHRWGGPLGVTRDWQPAFGIDEKTGVAFAGGYAGEGVMASYLVGSALAQLLCKRSGEFSELALLQRRFPGWEPEPLRWLGVSLVQRAGEAADRAEFAGRRAGWMASRIFDAGVKH